VFCFLYKKDNNQNKSNSKKKNNKNSKNNKNNKNNNKGKNNNYLFYFVVFGDYFECFVFYFLHFVMI
jgi:5-hydroxyisourate hydrolase-like protein (transthyretin family)